MGDFEDFLPTCNINQGTTYPILPIRCHCGKRVAANQRKIESSIGKKLRKLETENLSEIDRAAIARRETFKELGYIRTCCLLVLTLYPFLPFNDVEGMECIVDCTVQKDDNNVENNYLGYNTKNIPFEMFPVKKDNIGFDMDKYCQNLYNIVNENSVTSQKLQSKIKGSGETVYPKFAMLNPKRERYPRTEADELNAPPQFP